MGKGWRWTLRFKKDSKPVEPQKPLSAIKVDRTHFVFGLDWRLLPPTRRMARALAMAREEGQSWYASSELEDMVGYMAFSKWLRGPHHSAALHVASRYSQGGVELFALAFATGEHAILAFQESRPVPGFDFLGDAKTVRTMVDDFLAIQRGQPIRLVGNLDNLDGLEMLSPEDLFTEPAKVSRLHSLRSWRAVQRGLIFLVLAAAAAWGWTHFMDHRQKQAQSELLSSPAYQQKLYQQQLQEALRAMPPHPDRVLPKWQKLLLALPLQVQGWRLSHVECQIQECLAHWSRLYGSYADFSAKLPEGASGLDEMASDKELLSGKIVTRHPLQGASEQDNADFSKSLLEIKHARRKLADQMQDLQLLKGAMALRIEPVALLGGSQDPSNLHDPVFEGKFSLKHALWVFPSLKLPDYVRIKSFKVQIAAPSERPVPEAEPSADAAPAQVASVHEPFFEITGAYYAKK